MREDGRRIDHRLLHQLRLPKPARSSVLQQLRFPVGPQGPGPARDDGAALPAPVRTRAAARAIPVV